LKDGLDSISECKFVDDFLLGLVKVNFPSILAFGLWKLDLVIVLKRIELFCLKIKHMHSII
jgi:uncharacterized membrane protein